MAAHAKSSIPEIDGIQFAQYRGEQDMPTVCGLIDAELSEPYSVFTYRYFLRSWPHLCWIARDSSTGEAVGVIVGKVDVEEGGEVGASGAGASPEGGALDDLAELSLADAFPSPQGARGGEGGERGTGAVGLVPGSLLRGYIAMLVVGKPARGRGVGRALAALTIEGMLGDGCREVGLEAEATNAGALRLYGSLGFLRDHRLPCYYLNGSDAFRLVLSLPGPGPDEEV